MLILQKNLQIYFLITFCTCYNIIDQHSKNQKPKQIWKLFLLPPWKEFQQKNWKFWKQKQELWGDNRQWKRLLQCEVKWSEVTPIFKEGKHMTVLTQTDKLVAFSKHKIYNNFTMSL